MEDAAAKPSSFVVACTETIDLSSALEEKSEGGREKRFLQMLLEWLAWRVVKLQVGMEGHVVKETASSVEILVQHQLSDTIVWDFPREKKGVYMDNRGTLGMRDMNFSQLLSTFQGLMLRDVH